jgi:hypothetical protein
MKRCARVEQHVRRMRNAMMPTTRMVPNDELALYECRDAYAFCG